MFDLVKIVRNSIGETAYIRGKSYFLNNKITKFKIINTTNSIDLNASVLGEKIYDTTIGIYKKDNGIGFYCTCPAYKDMKYCKHLGGLALYIGEKYKITDALEIIDKRTNKVINSDEDKNTEIKTKNEEKNGDENPFFGNFLMNSDFFEKIKNNTELLNMLGMKYGENIYSEIKKKENKLDIFLKISNEPNIQDKEEEKLYKIKLGFIKKYYGGNDIVINLYKSVLQKNGKLSSGTQIKRENIARTPKKYIGLGPFLERNSSYYSGQSNDIITFNSGGENFISNLFNFDEIFDINNKNINLHKEIYNLKIHIEKEKNNYKISLILVGKTNSYKLIGFNLFGSTAKEYFAILSKESDLIFFHSKLNYSFIEELNNKKEIILNNLEFEELKNMQHFDYIVQNVIDTDSLGIEYIDLDPVLYLKIDFSNDYSFVKVEQIIIYDDVEITPLKNYENIIIKTKSGYIKRNTEKEIKELEKLLTLVGTYNELDSHIGKKYIDENMDLFFDEIEKLISIGVRVEYKQKAKRISKGSIKINLKVNSSIDFFDIESSVIIGNKEINNAKEILSQIKKGSKGITLENGNIILLKNDISKEMRTLDAIGINENDLGKKVKIGKYNIGLLKEDTKKNGNLFFNLDKKAKELKDKLKDFKKIEQVNLIKGTKIELRDYQKTGVNFINFLSTHSFCGILADDMGLGKTIQTLAYLEKIYSGKDKLERTIIICPTSLVFNWIDETNKFTPNLKIDYIKNGQLAFSNIEKDTQIIICSYGIISNLIDNNKIKETFEYIILDEAQNIKNPSSQRTKSIGNLKGKHRLALSGTPIENNLIELWSIFNFLMPGFLGNLNHFKSNYNGGDKDSLNILSRKVKPFILRRTKEEVLKDLPPKVEEYIKLEMGEKQKKFYIKLKNAFKLKLTKKLEKDGLNKSRFEVLDALLKLRQACLIPELVNISGNNLKDSIKLEYIDENIEDMIGKGHNLLIFSQFTSFLKYLKELLDKKEIKYNYLDGQTKPEDRKKLVNSFNSGEKNVFIISLKAGGTGLNLTQADYVIHLDPWWNPAVENQATDRAHRIGQQKTVFVQKLIVKDSIEEKILLLQDTKKKLIDDMFSGDFSGNLDKKDIDFIFS